MIEVKIEGTEQVAKMFKEMGSQLPQSAIPRALGKGARFMAAEIQRAAPRGGVKDKHSGLLEQSIYVRGKRAGMNSSAGVRIRGAAFYWRFLELGWRAHGTGNAFRYPFIAAVVESKYATAARIAMEDIGRAIKRISGK